MCIIVILAGIRIVWVVWIVNAPLLAPPAQYWYYNAGDGEGLPGSLLSLAQLILYLRSEIPGVSHLIGPAPVSLLFTFSLTFDLSAPALWAWPEPGFVSVFPSVITWWARGKVPGIKSIRWWLRWFITTLRCSWSWLVTPDIQQTIIRIICH